MWSSTQRLLGVRTGKAQRIDERATRLEAGARNGEAGLMRRSRYREQQIAMALLQAEYGTPVVTLVASWYYGSDVSPLDAFR